MILLREPSGARIRRFLHEQRSLPFSYPEVDASRDGAPPGYPVSITTGGDWARGRRRSRGRSKPSGVKRCTNLGWTKIRWPEAPPVQTAGKKRQQGHRGARRRRQEG